VKSWRLASRIAYWSNERETPRLFFSFSYARTGWISSFMILSFAAVELNLGKSKLIFWSNWNWNTRFVYRLGNITSLKLEPRGVHHHCCVLYLYVMHDAVLRLAEIYTVLEFEDLLSLLLHHCIPLINVNHFTKCIYIIISFKGLPMSIRNKEKRGLLMS
jgi:hypothetical protein